MLIRKVLIKKRLVLIAGRTKYCIMVETFPLGNVILPAMPVGYAPALCQISALVSVLFGYHFFREANVLQKLISAGIMVAGAIVITVLG